MDTNIFGKTNYTALISAKKKRTRIGGTHEEIKKLKSEHPNVHGYQTHTTQHQGGSNSVKVAGADGLTTIFMYLTFLNTTVMFVLNIKVFSCVEMYLK